ncbi:MAG: hypothetical protein SAJ12_13870, partial [Jaaginema sp. PMC 1079.18]|nr:hypothetical protein [Jaaginema sp. PMC 1079.18]
IRTIQAGHELIYDLDFSHDGTLMASTGQDGSIKVWNLENIQNIENPIKTMEIGTIVYRIRFHPQSKNILVSASEDGILRTWMIFNNLHQGRKNVNLFVESSCDFLADYFANNPQQQPRICQ